MELNLCKFRGLDNPDGQRPTDRKSEVAGIMCLGFGQDENCFWKALDSIVAAVI